MILIFLLSFFPEAVPFLVTARSDRCWLLRLAMLESVAFQDGFDVGSGYPKFKTNLVAGHSRFIQPVNFRNVPIFQFGHSDMFASELSTMPPTILGVFFAGTPTKVGESVVTRIAVKMATLQTFGTWTYKSKQHDAMYLDHASNTILAEFGVFVATFRHTLSHNSCRKNTPTFAIWSYENSAFKGFDTTQIRNSVQSLVSGNIPPVFLGPVGMPLNFLPKSLSGRIVVHGRTPITAVTTEPCDAITDSVGFDFNLKHTASQGGVSC